MKTGRKILYLTLVLALVISFAACGMRGSHPEFEASNTYWNGASFAGDQWIAVEPMMLEAYAFSVDMPLERSVAPGEIRHRADMIIYSGFALVETQEFDRVIEDVARLVIEFGGFVQQSHVTGRDYLSWHREHHGFRNAHYTIRVPAGRFQSAMEAFKNLGNVPFSSINADNITMQYLDVQARLTARQTEEARLLELLTRADSVYDIITIESRLSHVRAEIESFSSTIRHWDSQVSYSTLSIDVREVVLYTEGTPARLPYGERLVRAFTGSLRSVGRFFQGVLVFIAAALPALFVLAAVVVPVFFLIRSRIRKSRIRDK